ncbi:MAG: hypothetical protein Q8865_00580 [Bacillota bacterium]|nr:hypothetical protein [Bacillota bacterium]
MDINKGISVIDIEKISRAVLENPQAVIDEAENTYISQLNTVVNAVSSDLYKHKIIMLSGPSCSGKTTTALIIESMLEKRGIKAYTISLDDFFLDREKVPKNAKGNPDFESVQTLELDLLERCLCSLARGDETPLPHFHVDKVIREDNARTLRLLDNEVAIVEGIHALNDLVLNHLPSDRSYRLYVGLRSNYLKDNKLFLAKNELRLLRRTVRDSKFRSNHAIGTWDMWADVRHGEAEYIIPFADRADIVINSAFSYEPMHMKPFVLPLLETLFDTRHAEKAKRLYNAIASLPEIDRKLVPAISMLREFTGGSSFYKNNDLNV